MIFFLIEKKIKKTVLKVKKGDKVAVLIDIERKVKRGFMKLYEGPKLFIGIGIAQMVSIFL